MAPNQPRRPVPSASSSISRQWPDGCQAAAQALHRHLVIDDRLWHAVKTQPQRRAAEQLAAALVLLLDANNPPTGSASPQREQAIALIDHALGWLRGERRDPGCPSHGR